MQLLKSIHLTLWLGVLAACSNQDSPHLESKVQTALNEIGQKIASEGCKQVTKEEQRPVRNVHDPEVVDDIRTITCHDVEIQIYVANTFSPPKEIPTSLVLRGKDGRIPGKSSVGTASAAILHELGVPLRKVGEDLIYQADIEGANQDTITFKVKGGVIQSIVWNWYFP